MIRPKRVSCPSDTPDARHSWVAQFVASWVRSTGNSRQTLSYQARYDTSNACFRSFGYSRCTSFMGSPVCRKLGAKHRKLNTSFAIPGLLRYVQRVFPVLRTHLAGASCATHLSNGSQPPRVLSFCLHTHKELNYTEHVIHG